MRKTRGRILGLVVVTLVVTVALDLYLRPADRLDMFPDSTPQRRTRPASSARIGIGRDEMQNVQPQPNQGHPHQDDQGHPHRDDQGHPHQDDQGHPCRDDQGHPHHVRHNMETSYDNETGLTDFWSFVNKSYVEEHMSSPVIGQYKCQDVLCSEFLSRDDWRNFNACGPKNKHKAFNFLPSCHFKNGTSRPTVALSSFPGSGNTWTRQLLEKATGICTGSLYCDESIWNSGMVGENLVGSSVIVVKTHMMRRTEPVQYGAMIFLIRNPFDAVLSYWKWNLWFRNVTKVVDPHLSNIPAKFFQGYAPWDTFVNDQIRFWHDIIAKKVMEFKQSGHPVLVVRYEDLRKNHTNEVIRMLDFLNVTYLQEDVVQRLQEDLTKFKRTKPPLDFDPFTPGHRRLVNSVLRTTVNDLTAHNKNNTLGIEEYLSNM